MKILRVQFLNLNSLAGNWTVDFTSPEISGDGIFAITGPTGAGKSTILDAVCLALYGRTPRLEHVNKTTNEIMTRQTGECYSEIEFVTSRGRFRCHWSQHRARKLPSGELQPQKHEIVDCMTDKVLESKIKFVRQKVADVTGMDFNQFTRSILLAQGEFNTFLKADPDKRSPILEQITGTDIYSRISVKVHDILKEHKDILNRLTSELDGFLPLSKEQESEIRDNLSRIDSRIHTLDQAIQDNLDILNYHTRMEKLQAELASREQERARLNERSKELEPESKKRIRAEKAKTLEPLYQQLQDLRGLQDEEHNDLAQTKSQVAELHKVLENLEQERSRKATELAESKRKQKDKSRLFNTIRAKDLELRHLRERVSTLAQQQEQEKEKVAALQKRAQTINEETAKCTADIAEIKHYRTINEAHSRLVDELSGLNEQFRAFSRLSETVESMTGIEKELQEAIKKLDTTVLRQKEQLAVLNRELQEIHARRNRLTKEHKELLGGGTSAELSRKAAEAREKLYTAQRLAAISEQLGQLNTRAETDLEREQVLAAAIKETDIRKEAVEKEVALNLEALERQKELELLASKLKNYEEERARLTKNSPCPLCGSLDHPFVDGSCREAAEERGKLQQIQVRLNHCRQQQSEIVSELSRLSAEKNQLEEKRKETVKNRRELESALVKEAEGAHLEVSEKIASEARNLAALMEKKARELTNRHQKSEAVKEQIDELSYLLEQVTVRTTRAEKEQQSSEHTLKSLGEKLDTHQQERNQLITQVSDKSDALTESLREFTDLETLPANLAAIRSDLEQKRKMWLHNQEQLQSLSTTRLELDSRLRQNSALIETVNQVQQTTSKELSRLQTRLDQLHGERQDLFGDKDPDLEEKKLLTRISALENDQASCSKKLETERHRQISLNERVDHLTGQIGKRQGQLRDLDRQFLHALPEASMADEEEFLRSRMAEADFLELCEKLDDLADKISSNSAVLDSVATSINLEQAKAITGTSRQETEEKISRLRTERSELQQQTGALNQQLRDNREQAKTHREKMKAAADQQEEVDRWARLHELIGSADGKKFRNFAQGITFELMLSHANRTLQKMSDRYILIREPSSPLELSIIDNYQGGEMRTIKNLSGGESFLVSMALALGLSSMASQNVQVDSLFLDEGFGTLDEETLQTALDILSSLHQEGKLIGVISHVTGLQDRISAQIRVTRGLGGRSSLSGAGVIRPGI